VAAGGGYFLALTADGTVTAWGDVATNSGAEGTAVPAGLDHVTAIAASVDNALALRSDGTVVAWGNETNGVNDVPAEIQGHVARIAASPRVAMALLDDGTVREWGSTKWTTGADAVPEGLKDVVAIAPGGQQTPFMALTADHHVVSWGAIDSSVLGQADFGQYQVPAELQGHAVAIATDINGNVGAITDTGQVVYWGPEVATGMMANAYYQCSPDPSLADEKAVELQLAFGYVMARTDTGKVYTWGGCGDVNKSKMYDIPQGIQGNVTAIANSGGSEVALTRALGVATVPVVTGMAKVGQSLAIAADASFSGDAPEVSTQWLADGVPIAGATGSTLEVTDALLGKQITVAQTATLAGQSVTATSEPTVAVAARQSVTTLRATAGSSSYGTSVRVFVVASSAAATGAVRVGEGARVLGTASLAAGKATVTLPRTALRAGVHTLSVLYAGDADNAAAATSVRISVAKAAARVKMTVKPVKLTRARFKKAKAMIAVTTVGHTATGRLSVQLGVKKVTVTLRSGRAVVSLKALAKAAKKGKNKMTVAYRGDANTKAASTRVTLKLAR
jgi:hypothetical protein